MKIIHTIGIKLNEEQRKRLATIGELKELEDPTSIEDFLNKAQNADIIYSNGEYLLESLPKLKNVFITYPYVELGVFNSEELEKNGVFVANANGGNRDSIVERTIYMALSLFRNFFPKVRASEDFPFALDESLQNKKTLIVGHGTIGSQIGIMCKAFGMQVNYFNRGDNLVALAKEADLIINSLNCNSSSKNLLDKDFFMQLKQGSFFITFARPYTYDIDGLIASISANIVAGAAIDCDPEEYGDTKNEFYLKAMSSSKILVTPHIAFATKQASNNGREIAIQNIESFISGNPKNIIKKI